jgi:hypothetical protein
MYLSDGLFDTVDNGWRYDFALGGVPSLFLFIGFIFCPESPRYSHQWIGRDHRKKNKMSSSCKVANVKTENKW